MKPVTAKLTEFQRSALECANLEECPVTAAAWDGYRALVFHPDFVLDLMSELTDIANSEDAHAEVMRERGEVESSRRASQARDALTHLCIRLMALARK